MVSSRVRRRVRRGRRVVWYDSPWRIAASAVSIAVTVLLVVVVCVLFVVPKVLGGASLTVLTGSMEPVFMPGDVVVVRGVDEGAVCTDVGIGDIVTFFPTPGDPDLITHRVVAKTIGTFEDGTDCRLITQGDANTAVDEPVSPAQVRGVFMYGVPKLGWARQWVQQNPQAVMIVLGALVVAYLAWSSLRPPKTKVLSYGTTAQAYPTTGQGYPGPAGYPAGFVPVAAGPVDETEVALRARELAVREREVAVREAELALGTHRAPAWGYDPGLLSEPSAVVSTAAPTAGVHAAPPAHMASSEAVFESFSFPVRSGASAPAASSEQR